MRKLLGLDIKRHIDAAREEMNALKNDVANVKERVDNLEDGLKEAVARIGKNFDGD